MTEQHGSVSFLAVVLLLFAWTAGCAQSHENELEPTPPVGSDGDTDADTDTDTDTDGDTDTDTDTDTDSDTASEEEEDHIWVPRCCDTVDRSWCESDLGGNGRKCDTLRQVGRENFDQSVSLYSKSISTQGKGNSFTTKCDTFNKPNGADIWFSFFAFAGESFSASASFTSSINGGSASFLYLLKAQGQEYCGDLELVDCSRKNYVQLNQLQVTIGETGWYVIVVDSPSGSLGGGLLEVYYTNCSYSFDCSCWRSSDDPWGPEADAGPNADTDTDTDTDIESDAGTNGAGDAG